MPSATLMATKSPRHEKTGLPLLPLKFAGGAGVGAMGAAVGAVVAGAAGVGAEVGAHCRPSFGANPGHCPYWLVHDVKLPLESTSVVGLELLAPQFA